MSYDEIQDDTTIPDNERLWRRVFPSAIHTDEETYERRAQSGAFRDYRGPLSVDIASLTTQEASLAKRRDMCLAEFSAKAVRNAGCKIRRDPLPGDLAHALIYGTHRNGGLSGREAQFIARQSRIIPIN
ncbi:MAG: hypothetical protein OXF47_03485 [Nitrospira sp.]|nr:hypothetical protein [Nitrospira sp.]